MSNDRRQQTYRRVGDTAKCPACGSPMDSQAYRCPKCRIYFCYKCRARVAARDEQFQCADQSCECYGKLLCSACAVMLPEYGDVERKELLYDRVIMTVAILVGGIVGGFWFKSALIGIPSGLCLLLLSLLLWIYSADGEFSELLTGILAKKTTEKKPIADHRCCIQCKHPVKRL